MSRASILARGRAAAEAGMVDTCTVRRRTAESTAADGTVTPTWTTVYTGPCRIQEGGGAADLSGASSREESSAENRVLMVRRSLQLPVATSTSVRAEDVVTMDTCANDPGLVGREMTVRGEAAASEKTARRFGVEEITS